jgi:hypothetical protein
MGGKVFIVHVQGMAQECPRVNRVDGAAGSGEYLPDGRRGASAAGKDSCAARRRRAG